MTLPEERWVAAFTAARLACYSEQDARTVADRAESEAKDGIRNGTERFAGRTTTGRRFVDRPTGRAIEPSVHVYTWAGRTVDPLSTGIDAASTLD